MKAVVAVSLIVALAAISTVSGHVIATYEGMNLPIRSSTSPTTDMPQSVDGPCGGSTTFGANGVTTIVPGTVVNLQLRYAGPHPTPTGVPNQFAIGMICSKTSTDLNSDAPLRLYDTTNVNGQQVQRNQVNNIGIAPVDVDGLEVKAIPFTFPFRSPAGMDLSEGDFCTMSIMDERSWGGCIDVKVGAAAGPIVAGVVTPVIGIGAAAAIFFARGSIAKKLIPTPAQAVPEQRMWRTIFLSFVLMVLSCVSCGVPSWSTGDSYKSGPWSMCPTNGDCYTATVSGIAAIYAVRVFVLSTVIAAVIALALPVLAFYDRIWPSYAALGQLCLFFYMGGATFTAMMLWLCILSVGASIGAALVINIVVCVFSFIGAMLAYVWMKAIEVAPKETSAPLGIVTSEKTAVPSYPTQHGSGPKPYASHASPTHAAIAKEVAPPPPVPAHQQQGPQKWGDWEEIWDAENNAYYFFNSSNGESLWEPPEGWPHPARA